jgi:hypothetical protein
MVATNAKPGLESILKQRHGTGRSLRCCCERERSVRPEGIVSGYITA